MKKILTLLLTALFATACNAKPKTEETPKPMTQNNKVLVVYFSRTGEQYSVGNIKEGNTAIVAKMIADKTGADLFEIKLVNDTYPASYTALTKAAQQEKGANARPEVAGKVSNFDDYGTVFIGCPNWWGDLPMAVYTFMEQYDWSGKKVAPFVTHEGSGLSSIPSSIKKTTKADVLSGFALYGHEAQNERESAKLKVDAWLKKLGF